MSIFAFPLEQLLTYKPERTELAVFDAFWQNTLAETRDHPLDAEFTRLNNGLSLIDSYDVTFRGYGGQPVRGWLNLPRQHNGALPCIVEFIGYGGGRGFATDWLLWASAGYAHLVMDTRGQGSAWSPGDTPDLPDGANPFTPGFMTQGVLDPHTYYYRRLYADTVRAIEAARAFPAVDAQRIAVTGGSQGGGLTLAAAALDPT